MAVGVIIPQYIPKEKKETALDRLVKGLEIAGSVVGTAGGIASLYGMREQRDLARQQFEQQQAESKANKEFRETESLKSEEFRNKQLELENKRIENENKRIEIERRKAEKDIKEGIRDPIKNLPTDQKNQVDLFSKKAAEQQTIRNLMGAKFKQFQSAKTEDLKVAAGREMLKIINSPLGADAVGAEEAKRLGSFLEFKIANFTGPGSFVGRDIKLFEQQISGNLDALDESIAANKSEIDKIIGRPSTAAPKPGVGPQPRLGGEGTALAAPAPNILRDDAMRELRKRGLIKDTPLFGRE